VCQQPTNPAAPHTFPSTRPHTCPQHQQPGPHILFRSTHQATLNTKMTPTLPPALIPLVSALNSTPRQCPGPHPLKPPTSPPPNHTLTHTPCPNTHERLWPVLQRQEQVLCKACARHTHEWTPHGQCAAMNGQGE
jgi:hypothetical protein